MCDWVGAVLEKVTKVFGQEQQAQIAHKPQKSKKGTGRPTDGLWNIVDILAFGAFVLRSISLSFRWRYCSFACNDIFDYLDAFFLSVNQCILTSNSTWKHFGDYSGTCGKCTWLHLLTID